MAAGARHQAARGARLHDDRHPCLGGERVVRVEVRRPGLEAAIAVAIAVIEPIGPSPYPATDQAWRSASTTIYSTASRYRSREIAFTLLCGAKAKRLD